MNVGSLVRKVSGVAVAPSIRHHYKKYTKTIRKVQKMDIEKRDKIVKGLQCCGNKMPLAECCDCPYEKGEGNCTVRLLSDCGELVAELLGVNV